MSDAHRNDPAPVADEALLLTFTYGDRTVLRELIQIFLEDAPGQSEQVGIALAHRDGSALEQHAHALRGAAAGMTGARVAEVAARLEAAGRVGDWSGADREYGLLTGELAQLTEALLIMAEERER